MDFALFNRELGNADLFLIDQILKRTFLSGHKILDAGCGEGRNLTYFLQNNFEVYGIDKNISALRMLKITARMINKNFSPGNFIEGNLINHPFGDNFFDYILCISVLHFADSVQEFNSMFESLLKTLKINGILMLGMNSVYGIENQLTSNENNVFQRRDGSIRFLLNDSVIQTILNNTKVDLNEPIKSVITRDLESSTYLMLRKIG